ncbi:hypothetical protein [Pedobacter sp. MR2016-24]|uniref:hypothetical protein n=1 Tax=Pedobacter sp. MR2016-24 TaxID=2994466 RepID=UPI0022452BAB|nr:hypothetical protein [Pedobacter sp. MR2016-24]MCX2484939.1 hypothetical protein [Pedobacter sp. MR2016-24]
MEAQLLLNKIISSRQAEEVLSIRNFKKEYVEIVKMLHPDVCALPMAGDAIAKMNVYRKEMDKYQQGEDDAGSFVFVAENEVAFKGEEELLKRSFHNYQLLMSMNDESAVHFKKYLPQSLFFQDGALHVKSECRMLPLSHLTLTHEHADWILSRIYELISWFHQKGYSHLGINPESVFIVPETHGIVCVSFYHLTRLDTQPESLSGRYLNWYPAIVFKQKKAIQYIDTSLAQRTAIYAMGDRSGNGIVLKKSVNPELVDFLISPHYSSYQGYQEFRKLLFRLFGKPTFHQLNI